jgi:hypothetical protein
MALKMARRLERNESSEDVEDGNQATSRLVDISVKDKCKH